MLAGPGFFLVHDPGADLREQQPVRRPTDGPALSRPMRERLQQLHCVHADAQL